MPHATTPDGVKLYYEEVGKGTPIVFVHEFADDLYSWEPQIRFFTRRYRCIAYNARGYPPSDVPEDPGCTARTRRPTTSRRHAGTSASQGAHRRAVDGRLRRRCISACAIPSMALSLTGCGGGYGAGPDKASAAARAEATRAARSCAKAWRQQARVLRHRPDPHAASRTRTRAAGRSSAALSEHPPIGSALTMRGVQGGAPSALRLGGGVAGAPCRP